MNCKPGDLAVIVLAKYAGNLGKIVRVVRSGVGNGVGIGDTYTESGMGTYRRKIAEYIWVVHTDSGLVGKKGSRNISLCGDSQLRPIRDQPGNEQFVTELRNKLPRSKPATTKGDTIDVNGMVQS